MWRRLGCFLHCALFLGGFAVYERGTSETGVCSTPLAMIEDAEIARSKLWMKWQGDWPPPPSNSSIQLFNPLDRAMPYSIFFTDAVFLLPMHGAKAFARGQEEEACMYAFWAKRFASAFWRTVSGDLRFLGEPVDTLDAFGLGVLTVGLALPIILGLVGCLILGLVGCLFIGLFILQFLYVLLMVPHPAEPHNLPIRRKLVFVCLSLLIPLAEGSPPFRLR